MAGGTPAFLPPELFRVAEKDNDVDLKAIDIWSLGVTLYCMVYGSCPWSGDSEITLAHNIATLDITFPTESNQHQKLCQLDPHMKHLMRRMMDKDCHTRATLHEVIEDEWVTHEGSEPLFDEDEEEEDIFSMGYVLLIDPSLTSRSLITAKLEQSNLTYATATCPEDGIDILKHNMACEDGLLFDCIIIDFSMPGIGGIQCLKEIRALGFTGTIVGMSGESRSEASVAKDMFMNNGATAFLRKPISSLDLISIMRSRAAPFGSMDSPRTGERRDLRESTLPKLNMLNIEDINMAISVLEPGSRTPLSEMSMTPRSSDYNYDAAFNSPLKFKRMSGKFLSRSPSANRLRSSFDERETTTSLPITTNAYMNSPNFRLMTDGPLGNLGMMSRTSSFHSEMPNDGDSNIEYSPKLSPTPNSPKGGVFSTSGYASPNKLMVNKFGKTVPRLSRTGNFMLLPSDLVVTPREDRTGVNVSIAYTGVEGNFSSSFRPKKPIDTTSRRQKRERALLKSKIKHRIKSGDDLTAEQLEMLRYASWSIYI
jgi:CheY-like chemotaxis protein